VRDSLQHSVELVSKPIAPPRHGTPLAPAPVQSRCADAASASHQEPQRASRAAPLSRSSLSRVQDTAAAGTLPAASAPCPPHTHPLPCRLFDLCLWLFDIWSPIVGKKSEINDFWFKKNDFCLICRERNSFNGLSINRPFLFMQLELHRPIG